MGRKTISILREEAEQRGQEREKTMDSDRAVEQQGAEPLVHTVADLQKVLRIGRVTAYQLVNTEGFPVLRLGRKILIPADGLKEWLSRNTVA